jgi:hypothetical protein
VDAAALDRSESPSRPCQHGGPYHSKTNLEQCGNILSGKLRIATDPPYFLRVTHNLINTRSLQCLQYAERLNLVIHATRQAFWQRVQKPSFPRLEPGADWAEDLIMKPPLEAVGLCIGAAVVFFASSPLLQT